MTAQPAAEANDKRLIDEAQQESDAEHVWVPDPRQAAILNDPDSRSLVFAILAPAPFEAADAQAALDALVSRHAMLRTHYCSDTEGHLLAVTARRESSAILVVDFRSFSLEAAQAAAVKETAALIWRKWDVFRGPLITSTAFRLSDAIAILAVVVHHSVSDATSLNIMRRELLMLYQARARRTELSLRPVLTEYRAYVGGQMAWLRSDGAVPHFRYWRTVLSGIHSLFRLPYDFGAIPDPHALPPAIVGRTESATLPKLRSWAALNGTTVSTAFSTILATTLALWSRKDDVAMWVCHLGRPPRSEAFQVVGCFVDYWLLRVFVSRTDSPTKALINVHNVVAGAAPHLGIPLHAIIPEIQRLPKDRVHPGILVNFMPFAKASGLRHTGDLPIPKRPGSGLSKNSPLGLVVNCSEFEQHLAWDIVFNGHLWEEETMRQFSTCLAEVADFFADSPCEPLRNLLAASRSRIAQLASSTSASL